MKGCALTLALALVLAACGKHHDDLAQDRDPARALFEEVPLAEAPPGVSDLTSDGHGALWAIAERDRFVLQVALTGKVVRHPIDGIPAGLDTESLAWLADGRLVIGTEGTDAPTAAIVFANLVADHVVATRTRARTSGAAPSCRS